MAMIAVTTIAVLPGHARMRIPTMTDRTPPMQRAVRMPLTADFSAADSVDMRFPFWELPERCRHIIDPDSGGPRNAPPVCRQKAGALGQARGSGLDAQPSTIV